MKRAVDGSGLNPNCRECVGEFLRATPKRNQRAAARAERAKAPLKDRVAQANAVLTSVNTVVRAGIMPEVIALAKKMADRSVTFLSLDFENDEIQIKQLDRAVLSEEVIDGKA